MTKEEMVNKLFDKPDYIAELILHNRETARAILGDGIVDNYVIKFDRKSTED